MIWKHKCSLEWMQARQNYLTASDIKELLPVTKTGRTRKVTEDNYWKVYAKKMVNLTEDDCWSSGAAARGHLLEPYAIAEFNDWAEDNLPDHPKLYHWDDIVIPSRIELKNVLAFSPDAVSYPPSMTAGVVNADFNYDHFIGEVKSYNPENHYLCINTPENELEERWQIAVAMACKPKITEAVLLFFNPALKQDRLIAKFYDREDLKEEIKIVRDIESAWLEFIDIAECDFEPDSFYIPCSVTEEEIIEKIESPLNPV